MKRLVFLVMVEEASESGSARQGADEPGLRRCSALLARGDAADARLAEVAAGLKATDPIKAKALEQEVLFYARQNLADIQTQQAVSVNGYLALDVLKKIGREMMIGCDRVATTEAVRGMADTSAISPAPHGRVCVRDRACMRG